MPLYAQLDDEVVVDMLDRAARGESIKSIGIDLGLSEQLVGKYLAHRLEVVDGKRREKRAAIAICLDAGCDYRETAAKSGASVAEVARFVWASREEERARRPKATPEEMAEAQEAERVRRNASQRARYAARRAKGQSS